MNQYKAVHVNLLYVLLSYLIWNFLPFGVKLCGDLRFYGIFLQNYLHRGLFFASWGISINSTPHSSTACLEYSLHVLIGLPVLPSPHTLLKNRYFILSNNRNWFCCTAISIGIFFYLQMSFHIHPFCFFKIFLRNFCIFFCFFLFLRFRYYPLFTSC